MRSCWAVPKRRRCWTSTTCSSSRVRGSWPTRSVCCRKVPSAWPRPGTRRSTCRPSATSSKTTKTIDWSPYLNSLIGQGLHSPHQYNLLITFRARCIRQRLEAMRIFLYVLQLVLERLTLHYSLFFKYFPKKEKLMESSISSLLRLSILLQWRL